MNVSSSSSSAARLAEEEEQQQEDFDENDDQYDGGATPLQQQMDALRWKVVDAFFASNSLVSHHRDAYDSFVASGVQQILAESNPLRVDLDLDEGLRRFRSSVEVWFGGRDGARVRYGRPVVADLAADGGGPPDVHALLPAEARLRDLSYAMPVFCDVDFDVVRVLRAGEVPTAVDAEGYKEGTDWGVEEARAAAAGELTDGRRKRGRTAAAATTEEGGGGAETDVVASDDVPPLTPAQQALAERTLRTLAEDARFAAARSAAAGTAGPPLLVPAAEVVRGIAATPWPPGEQRVQRFRLRPNVGHLLMHMPVMVQSRACALSGLAPAARAALGECPEDLGGYFIVDGRERTVLCQTTFANNQLVVRPGAPTDARAFVASIRSVSDNVAKPKRTLHMSLMGGGSVGGGGQIVVSVPNIRLPVPLFVLFRALGVTSDSAALELVLLSPPAAWDAATVQFFRPSIQDAAPVHSQSEALTFMARAVQFKEIERVQVVLADMLLPHVGEACWRAKALFLGYMARELFFVASGAKAPTDRDHFRCKRVETVGTLLRDLVRGHFAAHARILGQKLESFQEFGRGAFQDVSALVVRKWATALEMVPRAERLADGVRRAFKGGPWGPPSKVVPARLGLVQDLDRLSFAAHLAHLRKLITPIEAGSKLVGPRVLHCTQYGILDPIDSPDGANVGVHNQLALLVAVSSARPRASLERWLRRNAAADDDEECSGGGSSSRAFFFRLVDPVEVRPAVLGALTRVMVNGHWFASTPDPIALVAAVRAARRAGADPDEVGPTTSVAFDIADRAVVLCGDGGRLCAPLFFRDEAGQMSYAHPRWRSAAAVAAAPFSWADAVPGWSGGSAQRTGGGRRPALLEYLDTQEREYALVSVDVPATAQVTHQEVDASTLYGMMSNLIPYLDHNPVNRNTFSSGQSKQAVSVYASNHRTRMDRMGLVLEGGQLPLTRTRYWRHFFGEAHPYGVNARVALMCYSGYNVEDALLINQAAVDRGLFRTAYYTTYVVREETARAADGSMRSLEFAQVGPGLVDGSVVGARPGLDFSKLGATGIIERGTILSDHTVLVGRTAGAASKAAAAAAEAGGRGLRATLGGGDDGEGVLRGGGGDEDENEGGGGEGGRGGEGGGEMEMEEEGNDDVEAAAWTAVLEDGGGDEGGGVDPDPDAAALARDLRQRQLDAFAPSTGARRDHSVAPKKGQKGVVVDVWMSADPPGHRVAKIKVLSVRTPAMGDKFASRAGQKGTIGRVIPDAEMPFFEDGSRPDMVVNPHAIPTRMTIGHLLETLSSHLGAHAGMFADATAYASGRATSGGEAPAASGSLLATLAAAMRAAGLHGQGLSVVYSGASGRPLQAEVFSGLTYYMRLKHMVADKINYRATGRVMELTRQPNKGRADDGGLRIGEMERDVFISHGMAAAVDDAMMTRSDAHRMAVCNATGSIAVARGAGGDRRLFSLAADGPARFQRAHDVGGGGEAARARSMLEQSSSARGRSFSMVDVPYALKTYVQELGAINVGVALVTADAAHEAARSRRDRGALRCAAESAAAAAHGGRGDAGVARVLEPADALRRETERALRRVKQVPRDALIADDARRRAGLPDEPDEDMDKGSSSGESVGSEISVGSESSGSESSGSESSGSESSRGSESSGSESGSESESSRGSESGSESVMGGAKRGAKRGAKKKNRSSFESLSELPPVPASVAYGAINGIPPPDAPVVEGDMVHLRGDRHHARLWSVTHVDAHGRLTVRTQDVSDGLLAEDSARVVERRDVLRPSDDAASYVPGPASGLPDQLVPPPIGSGGPGGMHFAPVINIVNNEPAAAKPGGKRAADGGPSGTVRGFAPNGSATSSGVDFGEFEIIKTDGP